MARIRTSVFHGFGRGQTFFLVDSSILFGIQARRKGVSSGIMLWQGRLIIEIWNIKFATYSLKYEEPTSNSLLDSIILITFLLYNKWGFGLSFQKICNTHRQTLLDISLLFSTPYTNNKYMLSLTRVIGNLCWWYSFCNDGNYTPLGIKTIWKSARLD